MSTRPLIVLKPLSDGALCGDESGNLWTIPLIEIIEHDPRRWSRTMHVVRAAPPSDAEGVMHADPRQFADGWLRIAYVSSTKTWYLQ